MFKTTGTACLFALFAALLMSAPMVRAQSGEFKVLYDFNYTNVGTAGSQPYAALVIGSAGVLYGTAREGGTTVNSGTVFSLTPPASQGDPWTETTLLDFNGTEGYLPYGGLTIDKHGKLYGTASLGGTFDGGVLFSLTPPVAPATTWTEDVLYNFPANSRGGFGPTSSVVFGAGGALYGTTYEGQALYALLPPKVPGGPWTPQKLHTFGIESGDGTYPGEGLAVGKDGTLYGTTQGGGASGAGTLYAVTPPANEGGAWTEDVLHSFGPGDGSQPTSIPAVAPDGVLYGTTTKTYGYGSCSGTIFSLTPPTTPQDSWTEAVLYQLTYDDGCDPQGGVAIGLDGVLYGVTEAGGASGCGTLYSLSSPKSSGGLWTYAILHSFDCLDGYHADASLVVGAEGVFYGTAQLGGTTDNGTVFAFKP